MEGNDIKEYMVKQFRPSAMVFSSPTAKQICKENDLTPAELLRPFSGIRMEQKFINMGNVEKEFRMALYDDTDYLVSVQNQTISNMISISFVLNFHKLTFLNVL